jgi:lysozyme family protein
VDGAFGATTAGLVATCDLGATLVAYCDTRERFYRRLVEKNPTLGKFLKGWLNRLQALRREIGLPGVEAVDTGDPMEPVARVPELSETEFLSLIAPRT